jgi:hypothetical protein
MRRGGKGDAIPLIAFHNAPLFKAGFFIQLKSEIFNAIWTKCQEKRDSLLFKNGLRLSEKDRTPLETENACRYNVESTALLAYYIRMIHLSYAMTSLPLLETLSLTG